jgi:hypothetical protein
MSSEEQRHQQAEVDGSCRVVGSEAGTNMHEDGIEVFKYPVVVVFAVTLLRTSWEAFGQLVIFLRLVGFFRGIAAVGRIVRRSFLADSGEK